MGMTMAEKVLARAAERPVVHPGEFVTANIDVLMGHDNSFYTAFDNMLKCGYERVWNPDAYSDDSATRFRRKPPPWYDPKRHGVPIDSATPDRSVATLGF